MDAYEVGEYELPDLTKRLAAVDGELSALHELQETASDPIEIGPELIEQVVEVFDSWASLSRSDKRDLLSAYRIRIHMKKTERRILKVTRVDVGLLSDVALYKKMKRLGIE